MGSQGFSAMGMAPFVFVLLYLGFLGFLLWVLLSVVRSLSEMAIAQSSAADAMRRIAAGLEKSADRGGPEKSPRDD